MIVRACDACKLFSFHSHNGFNEQSKTGNEYTNSMVSLAFYLSLWLEYSFVLFFMQLYLFCIESIYSFIHSLDDKVNNKISKK